MISVPITGERLTHQAQSVGDASQWLGGKESACRCRQETWVWTLGAEDPLEEGMATHPSIPAWRIPWTEEPEDSSPPGRRELESTERLSPQRVSGPAAQVLAHRTPVPASFKPLRAVGSSVSISHLPHKGSCSGKWTGTTTGDCTLLSVPVLWTGEELNLQCRNFSKVAWKSLKPNKYTLQWKRLATC